MPTAATSVEPSSVHARARAQVAVLAGDGIGPEVIAAARRVLEVVGAPIDVVEVERDADSGLPTAASMELIERCGVLLKGPLATPSGGGRKSPNVTLRKLLELHANIRPARALVGVRTPLAHGSLDAIIVRENLEDVYSGVEHAQTPDVMQCLKLVTRSGSRRAVKTAFEVAKQHGRTRVTCVTKANIMKLTDGAFLDEFRREAALYDDIETRELLVDAAACRMVTDPHDFDVIVTTNLYGDILSDLAAGLVGGLGLVPSANIGEHAALFEPVHGTAPDLASTGRANPTATILSTAMLLRHIGAPAHAAAIERAVSEIYAGGVIRTPDLMAPGARTVSCIEFAEAVAERAAHCVEVDQLPPATPRRPAAVAAPSAAEPALVRALVGVDVFVEYDGSAEALAALVQEGASGTQLTLHMISNRGVEVWPTCGSTRLVDHFRCRLTAAPQQHCSDAQITRLLDGLSERVRWMHVEKLEDVDGSPTYSRAYGAST